VTLVFECEKLIWPYKCGLWNNYFCDSESVDEFTRFHSPIFFF